jgi:hypothetical protein
LCWITERKKIFSVLISKTRYSYIIHILNEILLMWFEGDFIIPNERYKLQT